METPGWRLFVHPLFQAQLEKLAKRVEGMAAKNPGQYLSHPAANLLATINQYIRVVIPRDPNSQEFRQGNTLGPGNRHWFRARFHRRYRLFFRFSIQQKIIVYVWVNDDESLRKASSRTDPYAVFRTMLERGEPPDSFADLLRRSAELTGSEKRTRRPG